jgi:hypothetical protein
VTSVIFILRCVENTASIPRARFLSAANVGSDRLDPDVYPKDPTENP